MRQSRERIKTVLKTLFLSAEINCGLLRLHAKNRLDFVWRGLLNNHNHNIQTSSLIATQLYLAKRLHKHRVPEKLFGTL